MLGYRQTGTCDRCVMQPHTYSLQRWSCKALLLQVLFRLHREMHRALSLLPRALSLLLVTFPSGMEKGR